MKYSELAQKLAPYMPQGGSASQSAAAGGGSLPISAYPNALLRDGTRSLTGNLAVSAGVTIDGVDIGQFYADIQARLMTAGAGLSGGGTLAADRTFSVNLAYTGFTWTALHTFSLGIAIGGANTLTLGGDVALNRPSADLLALATGDSFGSASFSSGFAGSGFRITYSASTGYSAEFDNLIIRQQMRIYELLIHKIRSGNGSYLFAPGGRVATVSGSGPYTLTFETDHGMAANDIARAQKFDAGLGAGVYQSNIQVSSITDTKTLVATLSSGVAPAAGYEYVRIGNTTDASRQGGVYVTADDSGAPFLDVFDGVNSVAAWSSNNKLKLRAGNLAGITDTFFGALTGYGIWTNRGYFSDVNIKGKLVVGPGLGYSTPARFYAALDAAPGSHNTNTNGHLGQAPLTKTSIASHVGRISVGAAMVGSAITNRVQNPSVETNTTAYSTSGAHTITRTGEVHLFGAYSLRWNHVSGFADIYYNQSGTLAVSTTFTFSVYCRRADGAAVSGVTLYIDSTLARLTPNISYVGDGWYRVWATRTIGGSLGNHIVGVADLATSTAWYFDGWQVEVASVMTPYIDGSLGGGFAWTGTAHASTSTRAASQLNYDSTQVIDYNSGSISAWVNFDSRAASADQVIFSGGTGSGNRFFMSFYASNNFFVTYDNGSAFTVTHNTPPTSGWHHVAVTWQLGGSLRLYVDGVQVGTPVTITGNVIGGPNFWLGTYLGASLPWNGSIDDFAVMGEILTAEDIQAIASIYAPLNVSRMGAELVLTGNNYGRVTANALGIFATSVSGAPNFALLNAAQTINGESLAEGSVLFGDNTSGKANVIFDASAGTLSVRRGTTKRVDISATGVLTINDSAGAAVFTFDASAGAELTKALNFGASGGIWQGSSGTFNSPTTGIKIYKGGSGDGTVDLFSSSVVNVRLAPADGITFLAGSDYSAERALRFAGSAGRTAEVYGYTDGSTYRALRMRAYSNENAKAAVAYIDASAENTTGEASAYIWAAKYTAPATYPLPTAYVQAYTNNNTPAAQVVLSVRSKSGVSAAFLQLADSNGTQTWTATGVSKSWRIDHPLNPRKKWLDHFSIEGPGNYTFYKGRATLDSQGNATVQLPDYFNALNAGNVYQLTSIGQPLGGAHIATEVDRQNKFTIAGGAPGQVVCWIISGDRADVWAQAHPAIVETDKMGDELDKIAAWVEYGLTEDHGMKMQDRGQNEAGRY